MSIRIITDSASDIMSDELKEYKVELVPMPIICGSETFIDDKTIPVETFWKKLIDGETIKTSLPSPDSFLTIFEDAKNNGDEVICIVISSGFSGTIQSAVIAKDMCEYDNIHIIDSCCASVAQKAVVFEACRLRGLGYNASAIVESLEKFKKRVHLFACLDTLEYLARGGRLSGVAANIGNMLKLKPVITFTPDGKISVEKKSRGAKAGFNDMTEYVKQFHISEGYPLMPIFAHSDENCIKFEDMLRCAGITSQFKAAEGIGATIGTYIGPGAYGIVFVSEE